MEEYFEDFEIGDAAYPRPFPSLQEYMDWRMFGLLPYAGGLRDQDPDTLDDWRVIHAIEAEKQKEESKKQK